MCAYIGLYCSVLQCVAVFCSVLQCVAVCRIVLQCDAVWCSALQCVAVCCSMLQYVAVCCSGLQCVAVCCSIYCNVLQCVLDQRQSNFLENCSNIDFKLDWDHFVINVKVQDENQKNLIVVSSSSQTFQVSTENRHAKSV